jgi:hypothetical protein
LQAREAKPVILIYAILERKVEGACKSVNASRERNFTMNVTGPAPSRRNPAKFCHGVLIFVNLYQPDPFLGKIEPT